MLVENEGLRIKMFVEMGFVEEEYLDEEYEEQLSSTTDEQVESLYMQYAYHIMFMGRGSQKRAQKFNGKPE